MSSPFALLRSTSARLMSFFDRGQPDALDASGWVRNQPLAPPRAMLGFISYLSKMRMSNVGGICHKTNSKGIMNCRLTIS